MIKTKTQELTEYFLFISTILSSFLFKDFAEQYIFYSRCKKSCFTYKKKKIFHQHIDNTFQFRLGLFMSFAQTKVQNKISISYLSMNVELFHGEKKEETWRVFRPY